MLSRLHRRLVWTSASLLTAGATWSAASHWTTLSRTPLSLPFSTPTPTTSTTSPVHTLSHLMSRVQPHLDGLAPAEATSPPLTSFASRRTATWCSTALAESSGQPTQVTMQPRASILLDEDSEVVRTLTRKTAAVESIVNEDPGRRGIGALGNARGQMLKAAVGLLDAETVAIVTGFAVHHAESGITFAENDGPLGAVALARTLSGCGKKVTIVTDDLNKKAIVQLLAKAKVPSVHVGVFSIPVGMSQDAASFYSKTLRERLDAVITIERVGPAADGRMYNMRGKDITDISVDFSELFNQEAEPRPFTVGIGDGGNELGMGVVYDNVVKHIARGKQIACTTRTDQLITAGVSNWAGYGLALAYLMAEAARDGKPVQRSLAVDPDAESELLRFAIDEAGCYDGIRGPRTGDYSVDGLDVSTHVDVVKRMNEVCFGEAA